jgi:hypothetical protein
VKEDLQCLQSLLVLILSDNRLTSISNQFDNLRSLKRLYLSGNDITTVADGSFENTVLGGLDLASNRLRLFPDLSQVQGTIEFISLNDNEISTVNENDTKGMNNLHTLFLSATPLLLALTERLSDLPKLHTLNLAQSKLLCCSSFEWLKHTEILLVKTGETACASGTVLSGANFSDITAEQLRNTPCSEFRPLCYSIFTIDITLIPQMSVTIQHVKMVEDALNS